jgi:glutamate/tyrosine decarboxylase-like PLP-dependent enzyme
MATLLDNAASRATRYLDGLKTRRVAPLPGEVAALERLGTGLPSTGSDPADVLALLDEVGSPATVASAGGRYFGFIIGSALPAAVAADWLASAWNQNGAMRSMSPTAARLEELSVKWALEALSLPPGSRGALVTGDTMANLTCLAAARHAVLARAGWDLKRDGLQGAPRISVVMGEEVHVSVLKALAILGLGSAQLVRVPVDSQGRMQVDRLPPVIGPTIVCTQAGNVNSGAVDPIAAISETAHRSGAWVHVDGAFGLWARASPRHRPLVEGVDAADSWATDCHKWLNVPYDCGIAFVREPNVLRQALSAPVAAYLPSTAEGEPMDFVPEMSRRARGAACWAALRSLGRSGLEAMVERTCEWARMFADRLRAAGYAVLNDVVLNQVLVSFGSDAETRRVVSEVQEGGVCWVGPTVWHGMTAMRISVSSWATTREDVDASVDAILRAARSHIVVKP